MGIASNNSLSGSYSVRLSITMNIDEIIIRAESCTFIVRSEFRAALDQLKEAHKRGEPECQDMLLKMNKPPHVGDPITPAQCGWLLLSSQIFALNPEFDSLFPSKILNGCLNWETEMIFALNHSDAVSDLLRNAPSAIDVNKCTRLIGPPTDLRALYAIKALQWVPDWHSIKRPIFSALFCGLRAVEIAAAWLVKERADPEELRLFLAEHGLRLSCEDTNDGLIRALWSMKKGVTY